eukprot:COSAG02_NODE_2933_length_7706_cov_36.283292_2_plen_293_part_00
MLNLDTFARVGTGCGGGQLGTVCSLPGSLCALQSAPDATCRRTRSSSSSGGSSSSAADTARQRGRIQRARSALSAPCHATQKALAVFLSVCLSVCLSFYVCTASAVPLAPSTAARLAPGAATPSAALPVPLRSARDVVALAGVASVGVDGNHNVIPGWMIQWIGGPARTGCIIGRLSNHKVRQKAEVAYHTPIAGIDLVGSAAIPFKLPMVMCIDIQHHVRSGVSPTRIGRRMDSDGGLRHYSTGVRYVATRAPPLNATATLCTHARAKSDSNRKGGLHVAFKRVRKHLEKH